MYGEEHREVGVRRDDDVALCGCPVEDLLVLCREQTEVLDVPRLMTGIA